jgi:hypothetical protein
MEEKVRKIDITLKNIEVDFETADRIIVAEMLDQYNTIKREIKIQKDIKNPEKYQEEDLEYNIKLLDAVTIVFKHYTVPSDWLEEMEVNITRDGR